jgi:outer membrane receptor protein involved in Fe transport
MKLPKSDNVKSNLKLCHLMVFMALLEMSNLPAAAELNTNLPVDSKNSTGLINLELPVQPLSVSLKQFSELSGIDLSFDSSITKNLAAPAVKGRMTRKEALQKLLNGSGLNGAIEGDSAVIKKTPDNNTNIQLDQINVRAKRFYEIGPLPGLGLTKEQIPGNVQSITAKEIKESHSLSITDLMNKKLQSVTVNDYQGNPFQMDVSYRGFTAGPQIGTPQGLSVFFDGIRVNEPFGDVVNWDMIPMNALASVDVFPGSNPIFGLNTLGGAFTVKTKDGFNHEGVDAEVLYGSFNRKQLQVEGGWNNGTLALFGAGNFFLEDGWRDNSPSKVNQFFGKASYRGDKLDLNLSTLIVGTDLTGNGLLPSEEYARDPSSVFTSPDTTKNRLQQFQLSSNYFVNDNFTVTGQVYRRNSKRHQVGADVMRDYDGGLVARRLLDPSEQYTCLYRVSDTANAYGPGSQANRYGVPDYLVLPVVYTNTGQGNNVDFSNTNLAQDFNNGTLDINNYTNLINSELPEDVLTAFRYIYEQNKNFREFNAYTRGNTPPPLNGPNDPNFFNENSFDSSFGTIFTPYSAGGIVYDESNYFFTRDPNTNAVIKNYVMVLTPLNMAACDASNFNSNPLERYDPDTFAPILVDGFELNQPGVVEGTPTALFTDNQIDQITDGASVQLNWNFEHHKFMVGASIDSARAEYTNEQKLGFLDANRRAYLDPAQAHPQFATAFVGYKNNDFEGTNITKSIYFSETWTPSEAWNFSASGRYNQTRTKNKIAARSGFLNLGVGEIISEPDRYNVCGDTNRDGVVTMEDCAGIPLGYRPLNLRRVLDPAETEKFSYYSFNPSLGATWQAKENLNLFANWSKGTRTPSAIELGCALDRTPSGPLLSDGQGGTYQEPKSVAENRQCSLPTALSGDPYLPQIRATTYDIGMRGTLNNLLGAEAIQWNLGAYQTDLKDDIYFVTAGGGSGFFDTIGRTRRRGIEAGLSGRKDKWGFGINYGLTDATFQSNFLMLSEDNSSAKFIVPFGMNVIEVEKGNRMPGISLHNLNANISYEVTSKWQVGLSAVMHSESFVRGNENNKHKVGVTRIVEYLDPNIGFVTASRQPTTNPGKVPGYATFNFQTSYKFNSEWTASMQVTNLFDKEYFTAGRLGSNPFSPSINGAVGVSGYNHNSGDWLSTNFIAPSAPRGVWFSLNWQFDPNAKPSF